MTYTGLPNDAGPSQAPIPEATNAYTHMGQFPEALYVVRGTVLAGFQGAQYYDVATDFGRIWAISPGIGRGILGANEAAGYLPGEQVLVAVSPANPAFNGFIIGRADYGKAPGWIPPCPLLVSPQVAGFIPGEMMSGQASSQFARIRDFNSGIKDAVDGDWIMHNMFGGAIGVEAFRTFLQAGPAAGIHAYTEDGHLKVIGARFERLTFSEEYEDRQLGAGTSQVARKVLYPGDAISGAPHQILEAVGPMYGGDQFFYSYPGGANGAGETVEGEEGEDPSTTGRIALLHEYRGMDGSYMLSAARSITLRKSVRIPIPEYVGVPTETEEVDPTADSTTTTCAPCGLDANYVPPANVSGENATEVVMSPFSAPPEEEAVDAGGPTTVTYSSLSDIGLTRGFANALISQALSGFRRLEAWSVPDTESATGTTDLETPLMSRDPNMWKCVPQYFELALDPYGNSKNYVWGDAIISITEGGGIVLQGAQGEMLSLAGGNIIMSCQHDIIQTAGRNSAVFAGRDIGIRAGRHIDVTANYGRMTMVCASQFSILGGMDGNGGILIESKGNYHGTTQTGENPAAAGGVVIKSRHYVGLDGGLVDISAKHPSGWSARQGGAGIINLDAGSLITFHADQDQTQGSFGQQVVFDIADTVVVLGPTSIFTGHVAVCKNTFYSNFIRMPDKTFMENKAFRLGDELVATIEAMTEFINYPVEMGDEYTTTWFTSSQRNLGNAMDFQIPQPEWEVRAQEIYQGNSLILNTAMSQYTLDGTEPFPGNWGGGVAAIEIQGDVPFAPGAEAGDAVGTTSIGQALNNLRVGI